ncbi:class I tRNA ligase family protein [Nocardia sp. CA2R105]|uniref:class I tRNA ligase family protein n=1 Tax=Nocardia coffeae TaxID=2873381 RepID=UPI001CA77137|nr:class I tRNA ligase family protein [Nocardia coffeae]MBY8858239.1 class I tRNA ligase family protein [Nocardia coffeae]
MALRRDVHAVIAATTALMESTRLNVAVAQLMQLTNLLRKAVDTGPGPADPVVREGVEALVRMSSCFAPFTAEESWERLGHRPSVSDAGWPTADPALLERDTTTCIVQIDGKLRDRLEVPADIDETSLRDLALAAVTAALAGRSMTKVIVRAPRLVNVVTKH